MTALEALLAEARAGLERLDPTAAADAVATGAALVDIRSESQIARDGRVPGATEIQRNVLEWRLEPGGEHAIAELARAGLRVIVLCSQGYQSSLAAASLRRIGVDATDVIGGFEAWRETGLAVAAPRG